MNNEKLFKALAEYYGLDPEDWYQMHGLWILKHNAVRKISKQKTKDGHSVVVPVKWDIIKDGTIADGGVHGPEVVFSGTFRLIDSNGKTIHQVFAIGEANKENCKLPHSWAMAFKRCFDRGVLDLLSFAELGVYSAEEAASFAAAAPSNPVKVAAPLPSVRNVDPPAPPPAIPTPAGGGVPIPRPPTPTAIEPAAIVGRDPEEWQVAPPSPEAQPAAPRSRRLSHDEAEEMTLVAIGGGACRPKDIREATGLTQSQYQRAIAAVLEQEKVSRTGQKAGTRYHLAGQAPVEEAPEAPPAPVQLAPAPPIPAAPPAAPQGEDLAVAPEEFEKAFDKAIGFGVSYLDVRDIVTKLTGCAIVAQAHEQGKVTQSVIDELLRIAEERAA